MLTFILIFKWTNCENFSNQNVVNLKHLQKIEITDYKGTINKEVFSFLEHLTELELKNGDFALNSNFLQALPRLRKLTLMDNKIRIQKSNVTGCCEYIKEFRSINNKVNGLTIEDVTQLRHLFVLVLTGNTVPILRKNVFHSPRIMQLNITYSNLKTIEVGAFISLSELTVLNLEGNKLKSLTKDILEPLTALKTLVLKNNLLEVFSGKSIWFLNWLEYVDISENPVKVMDIEHLKEMAVRLKVLDATGINGTQGVIRYRQ